MSRLVLGRNVLVTQLSPHGHDLGEPFDRSVPLHNSCRHNRDILCDQPRIKAVVLGQHAAGSGELTKLVRVDTSHRQPRCEQGTDDPALVTPLGSRPIAETVSGRNLATSSAQPAVSLLTEKNHPSGSTTISKRSFDTSTPQKESLAIFVSHPC